MKWLKRVSIGLLAVIILMAAVAAFGYVRGDARMAGTVDLSLRSLTVDPSTAEPTEGRRLAAVYGCTSCHGEMLEGQVWQQMPAAIGTVAPPNLTNAGVGAQLDDAAWVMATRHGVGHDGRPLFIMPAGDYIRMPDADLAAIIAWARSLPGSPAALPASEPGPVGRIFIGLGLIELEVDRIDHAAPLQQVTRGATVEYGAVLGQVCSGCHGEGLVGREPGQPGPPAGPDIRGSGGLSTWTADDLRRLLTTGHRPDGTAVAETMPWQAMGTAMTDADHAALWAYLTTL